VERRLSCDLTREDPRLVLQHLVPGVVIPEYKARTGRDPLPETCNLKDNRSKLRGRCGRRAFAYGPNKKGPFDPMKRETTTLNQTDEAKIHELFEDLLEDWGRGDGEAYGSRFTDDADYVAFDGSHTKGREDIAFSHQRLFDKFLKGTRLTGRILSIKFPGPDVALIHATGGTVMRGKTKPSPERASIQTLVAVREGSAWRFAAFHNSRVRPIGGSAATFLIWAVTDRLWRIFAPGKGGA
jgi:uncharacterized protein (TIGR02246 family)